MVRILDRTRAEYANRRGEVSVIVVELADHSADELSNTCVTGCGCHAVPVGETGGIPVDVAQLEESVVAVVAGPHLVEQTARGIVCGCCRAAARYDEYRARQHTANN